ncbi:MAG: hypothetical protein ACYCVV_07370, partial [Acidimicrobiales bacterium]
PHSRHAVCDEGFVDFVQRSALQPVHRNPAHRDRDGRKGRGNPPEPVIQQSKRPPELSLKV